MDDFENDIYGGVSSTSDPNYDPNWNPVAGVDDLSNLLSTGGTSPASSNFLSRLFGGNMTSGDKAGAMLGLGALAIAQSLANKPPTIKQPVYKQAPVYNRALTAPMYGLGYLNPQTGKQIGMGMPLFFNPNPFQFDPTEAAKRYGPTPAEIAAGEQVYSQKMAELYTPRTVPDVQMTGYPLAPTTQSATQQTTTQPATQQAAMTVPAPAESVAAETGMARGGFLNGKGDGMSDEINATINEKQPARLSDGEFVIPADVVAHLGNGSSKAGANKLYEMMARIRKARTGTAKQAPKINPNKFV
jgi:hypothetical protein